MFEPPLELHTSRLIIVNSCFSICKNIWHNIEEEYDFAYGFMFRMYFCSLKCKTTHPIYLNVILYTHNISSIHEYWMLGVFFFDNKWIRFFGGLCVNYVGEKHTRFFTSKHFYVQGLWK